MAYTLQERIARNTQIILQEETSITKVIHIAGHGSGVIVPYIYMASISQKGFHAKEPKR